MSKILLVEDEDAISEMLQYNLVAEGHDVEICRDGEEANLRVSEEIPDLVILDWMLPNISGIELCRRFRATKESQALPIIMLTARGQEAERIRGLETGADDYLVKPFSVLELIARVNALLRRSNPAHVAAVLSAGNLSLDRQKHRVTHDGKPMQLSPTEFRLLELFLATPGRVFSREQLLNTVWGTEVYVDDRTVDVHIGRLRKILAEVGLGNLIRTVRGAGYSLDEISAS